jgi:putative transposase
MKRSKFSEEQIVYAIRQAESGTPVGDLCRQLGVSDATFYAWKKKYAHLGVSELCRLRPVEEENSRLKRLVADLSLDTHRLSAALRKKSTARPPSRTGRLVSGNVSSQLPAGLSSRTIQSGRLVPTKPSERSVRVADAHSRSGPCPPAVWVATDLGALTTRRLARESQAGATALSAGGIAAPHAGPATQAHRAAPRTGTGTGRPDGALEHGFCA